MENLVAKQIVNAVSSKTIEIRDPGAAQVPTVVVPRLPAPVIGKHFPVLIAGLGTKGKKRFMTFFTDNIRNKNTREAYFRAAFQFFAWCEEHGLEFAAVQSFHVSAYNRASDAWEVEIHSQAALYDRRDQKITRGEVERITILG